MIAIPPSECRVLEQMSLMELTQVLQDGCIDNWQRTELFQAKLN
jgi:hypothetical protein